MLDEKELRVRQSVAEFVDQQVLPVIADAFDEGRYPGELTAQLADLGLFGCTIRGYGCAGLNNICYGLACQELERADSALRSFFSVQSSLVMWPIFQYGSEQQRQQWLPALARAEAIGCFGLTEAHGGSDPGVMNTRARKVGSGWVLNGSKKWITNGSIADLALVWANTEQGIRGFLVPTKQTGYQARDVKRKFSLRASVTSEIFFDDLKLPASAMLPEAKGLKAPLSCLTQARYGIAWGAIGAAIACMSEALEYSKTRILFERPLAQTQSIQRRLANMVRGITGAQLMALQLGRLKDQGQMTPSQVSLAKWNNVRMALDIARDTRDLLGGSGITLDYSAIRHMLNLESVITYEGTETIHELAVGRELTGMSSY